MPLEQFTKDRHLAWGRWKITETEAELAQHVVSDEKVPDLITNPVKRLEYLAGRALIRELLHRNDIPYHGIVKDIFGKPFLYKHTFQISLSHSFPYVAAVLDTHGGSPVGIDLEQPKPKLLKIAPRILHAAELHDAGNDVVKHCIYWCAKEALVKIHGKKDLIFAENLRIMPFSMASEGDILGKIIANGIETAIPLRYVVQEDHVMVVSTLKP